MIALARSCDQSLLSIQEYHRSKYSHQNHFKELGNPIMLMNWLVRAFVTSRCIYLYSVYFNNPLVTVLLILLRNDHIFISTYAFSNVTIIIITLNNVFIPMTIDNWLFFVLESFRKRDISCRWRVDIREMFATHSESGISWGLIAVISDASGQWNRISLKL